MTTLWWVPSPTSRVVGGLPPQAFPCSPGEDSSKGVRRRYRQAFAPDASGIPTKFEEVCAPPPLRPSLRFIWWPAGKPGLVDELRRIKWLQGCAVVSSCLLHVTVFFASFHL